MAVLERPLSQSSRVERLGAASPVDQFQALAKLHLASIHGGIIENLGPRFLTLLYRQLSRRSEVVIYAAYRQNEIIGFVIGTINLVNSIRKIGLTGFAELAWTSCSNLWRPDLFRKVIQTSAYFGRRTADRQVAPSMLAALDPTRAELLAIAVSENMRGQGLGRTLVNALEQELANRGGRQEYFVSTNRNEIGSNAFYQSTGFELIGQKNHHDLILNVYRKELQP